MGRIEVLYHLLCCDGFLPPRNEEELLETENRMSNYKFMNDDKHVDVMGIINGTSCKVVNIKRFDDGIEADPMGIAARNFEKLPQNVIEKIKMQHLINNKVIK